jgi:hypothetical protein
VWPDESVGSFPYVIVRTQGNEEIMSAFHSMIYPWQVVAGTSVDYTPHGANKHALCMCTGRELGSSISTAGHLGRWRQLNTDPSRSDSLLALDRISLRVTQPLRSGFENVDFEDANPIGPEPDSDVRGPPKSVVLGQRISR